MGNLHCLDAATGKIKWQRDLAAEYDIAGTEDRQTRMPIWGIAASPLVVNDLVILHIGGREGACVVAHRLSDGEPVWRALEDRAQYSSPILIRQADQDVVVVWTGDGIAGLDPASGKVHWHELMTPVNMPIGIATPIVRGDRIFVTSFYDGAMMLNISSTELTADVVWQKRGRSEKETDGLHSIISTPVWLGEHIYGVDSYGELRCLIAETGERVWEDLSATPKARWSNIHFVQHGDRMWMFNERGELIIGKLSPEGFAEIDRAKLLEPTKDQLNRRGGVCWSHPAFANKHIFVRNDEELVCASLAAGSEIDP
jgi:outer membrane protein assembly factor BamB